MKPELTKRQFFFIANQMKGVGWHENTLYDIRNHKSLKKGGNACTRKQRHTRALLHGILF